VALECGVEVVAGLRPAHGSYTPGALERAGRDGEHLRAPGLRRPGAGMGLAHEAAAHDRDVDHPRPSAFRCEQARAIDALTPASSAAFASASMFARKADSFSSWLAWPPIEVFMTGRP